MSTFDSHPKSKFWSKRNVCNPCDVALNSHKKFWFDCECGHAFDCNLKNINLLDRWCPYCANKKLCEFNRNCIKCFENCFASVERSKNWSDKNFEEPFELFKNSHKKYWFNCECGHEFQAKLSDITSKNSWCPYCANKLMCNEKLKCKICHNKSFASINKSSYWSIKNKKNQ